MWGYILNFFRYATFPSNIKSYMRDYLNLLADRNKSDKSDAPTLLVYGDYDRMRINAVSNFSRYRDVDKHAQHWLGSRQTVLLYRLENTALEEGADLLSNYCAPCNTGSDAPIRNYRNFLIFTMVTINSDLHKYKHFAHILNRCQELIKNQIESGSARLIEPNEVSYQVYGSFSSSELVIVWSVNQYVDAFRLVEVLRHSSFEYKTKEGEVRRILPFASLYSIVSQPMVDPSRISAHRKIEGTANLKFVFQDGVSDPAARKRFFEEVLGGDPDTGLSRAKKKKDNGQYSVGEYDYSITRPADDLCNPKTRAFRRHQKLHWAQNGMHKYISSSCVQLYYDVEPSDRNAPVMECQELADILPVGEEDLSQKITLIKRMIYGQQDEYGEPDCPAGSEAVDGADLFDIYRKKGLRSIIKKTIPETDGLCDSLDLLFTDFVNNCSNLTNTSWSLDLVTQFVEIIDYIVNRFCASSQPGQNTGNLFSDIKKICEIYVQMIYHIAQSRRTVFIVPSCHLRYMGQYDMILHAYYGWEKYLLDLAYSLPHQNGVQPFLVPILTIDVLPEIHTEIYKLSQHYRPEERISNIFSINMPLGAMTDFLRYALTMCHETAHLIIPFDRDQRNQVFGMLFFSELVASLLLSPVQTDYWKTSPPQKDFLQLIPVIKRGFTAIIYNHLRPFFLNHIHAGIMNDYKGKPDSCPPWEEYRVSLKEQLAALMREPEEFSPLFEALDERCPAFQKTAAEIIDGVLQDNYSEKAPFLFSEAFCEELKKKINGLMHNPLSTRRQNMLSSFQSLFDSHGGNLCNESYVLSEAYREACQDLFMIRVFQLELADYLVFIDRQRNDTVILEEEPPKAEMLRIAMVCDYMITQQDTDGDPIPTEFQMMKRFDETAPDYVNLFTRVPELRKKDRAEKEQLQQRVKNCFENIRKELELYFVDYSLFRPLLLKQLESSDPFIQAPAVRDHLMQNGMRRFYDCWKDAILEADGEDDRAEQEMHRKLFTNNIQMIQRFQTQPTFESLALKLEGRDSYDGENKSI